MNINKIKSKKNTRNSYIKKIKMIIPTFLVITFGSVLGIGFIRWQFFIKYTIIDINEEIWNIWIPIIFPLIPILIWLRKRFKTLKFNKIEQDKGISLLELICWITISAMLLISQGYLTKSSGKLTNLTNIQKINNTENTRFYKIKNFYVVPNYGGFYTDFSVSGRFNNTLNIDIYFVNPIIENTYENFSRIYKYWYGTKFHKNIDNKLSDKEKDIEYQKFLDDCLSKMNKYNFYNLSYFERLPKSIDKEKFFLAVEANIKQKADDSFVILQPVSGKFEERNENKLLWFFGSFVIGLGVLLIALIFPVYIETERKRFSSRKNSTKDNIYDILKYLIPNEKHFATSIIINLNILLFIIMIFYGVSIISPNEIELLEWGANRRTEIINGEFWRLITSIFLHEGIIHLVFNIYGLIISAIYIEPIIGRKNYFILYILSGISGNIASIFWHQNSISLGASGAIFGLNGALLGLLLINVFPKEYKYSALIKSGIFVGINLLMGLTGSIDNASHIGGLLSGFFICIILFKSENSND